MQVKFVVFLQNILTLQMIILCKLQNAMGFGTLSCVRADYLGQGNMRVTFLREESAGLRLYATLWSDMRLMSCEVRANPLTIENYCTFCNRSNEDERLTQRFNLNDIYSPNAPCIKTDAAKGDHSATKGCGKLRRKRSWIFPGTLWCGTGSKAFGFDELGMFESADRCCREHDHCHHIIPAFTVNYGVFNPNFFTVSHCDCDQRFRQCLLNVNDTISSMVLYSFFKIMKVPCFELKVQKRCTELYWWGMCKVTQEAPYAIFKKPIDFNSSFTSKSEKSDSSKSATSKTRLSAGIQGIKPSRKKPRPKGKCNSKDPPRGDTFFRMTTYGCRRNSGKQSMVAPHLQTPSLETDISSKTKRLKSLSVHSAVLITANRYVKATSIAPTTALSSKRPDALQLKRVTTSPMIIGNRLSTEKSFQSQKKKYHLTSTFHIIPTRDLCESLKHLDECRYKIPPLKKRFGLKNLDTKPAYHCTFSASSPGLCICSWLICTFQTTARSSLGHRTRLLSDLYDGWTFSSFLHFRRFEIAP
uniref:Phospholipase A2-like central domain-containing protein n=1 Tax=Neogobius melanostomus TaxID=47308 RepID=A0A8C6V2Y2_9GOBI